MKRLLASFALIVATATLSGCYYDPGYSYVRSSGHGGDAYYGECGNAYYVVPGYYDGYYGGYYGGGYYGCCYAPGVSVGIGSVWYGGSRYRHGGYRDHRDYRRHGGHWQGRRDGGSHGGHRQGHQSTGSHGRRGSHDGNHRRGRGDRDRRH
jgi:hypothetical protein